MWIVFHPFFLGISVLKYMEHLSIFSLLYVLKTSNVQRTIQLNISKFHSSDCGIYYLWKCLEYSPGLQKVNKIFLAKAVYRFQLQLCSINHITNFINISHDSYVASHVFALNRECYQIVKQRSLAPEKGQIVAVCTR